MTEPDKGSYPSTYTLSSGEAAKAQLRESERWTLWACECGYTGRFDAPIATVPDGRLKFACPDGCGRYVIAVEVLVPKARYARDG